MIERQQGKGYCGYWTAKSEQRGLLSVRKENGLCGRCSYMLPKNTIQQL